jgi:hypothetical protein
MRARTKVSIFDGTASHEPGAIVSVDPKQAKRLVLRGHSDLVDDAGEPVPLEAAMKALAVNDDDLRRYGTPVAEEPA